MHEFRNNSIDFYLNVDGARRRNHACVVHEGEFNRKKGTPFET